MSTVERGRFGEQIAVQALQAHGYTVLEQNWRCQAGEVDIIARDADTWAFVEVKLRRGDSFGTPEEAVTPAKQERLAQIARIYLGEHDLDDVSWRVDVVAIELSENDRVMRLEIYRDAVRLDG